MSGPHDHHRTRQHAMPVERVAERGETVSEAVRKFLEGYVR